MEDRKLVDAAVELVKVMDKAVDEGLPVTIADIVKFHSKGAAIAAVAGGWIPGAGGLAAVAVSGGFIWTMYGRINGVIELPFSQNLLKSVAAGVATNLAGYAVGSIAITTALSLFPGVGSIGASAVAGATCYALTLASGFVYLKLLTRFFKAGQDPTLLNADELKKAAETVAKEEDIKGVMKEAKQAYKVAKSRGELDEEDPKP